MKKSYPYILGTLLIMLVAYQSVYVVPLDEKLVEQIEENFDVEAFVDSLWPDQILYTYDSAIAISKLLDQLDQNPTQAFEKWSRALGIGSIGYFKVMGVGTVQGIHENNVLLLVDNQLVEIETEFIFGNAVRDASGLIEMNDFKETSDFNRISEQLNARIRQEVIPDFRAVLQPNSRVAFKGAIELNRAHLDLELPEIIPVSLEIIR